LSCFATRAPLLPTNGAAHETVARAAASAEVVRAPAQVSGDGERLRDTIRTDDVMAGPGPAIHALATVQKAWMPAPRAGVTA
jgi:hypothetical protein